MGETPMLRLKKRSPYPQHELARPVRKWYPDHKGFFAVSSCVALSKNFLHNFYFCLKHHARPVRCGCFNHRTYRTHGDNLNKKEIGLADHRLCEDKFWGGFGSFGIVKRQLLLFASDSKTACERYHMILAQRCQKWVKKGQFGCLNCLKNSDRLIR